MKQKRTFINYEKISVMGKGGFGIVYKVKDKLNKNIYALKKINLIYFNNQNKDTYINEIKILSNLKNQFVIGYKESFFDLEDETINIVMELGEGGDMLKFLKDIRNKNIFLSEKKIINFFHQILKGLNYIHNNKIIHRDLKLANIFLDKNKNKIKIGDFGVSKILEQSLAFTQVGTPFYTSPEIWLNLPYSYKTDLWSLGCMIYELCNHKPPFFAENKESLKSKILNGNMDIWNQKYSRDLYLIVKSMLEIDSSKRISIDKILRNRLFLKDRSISKNTNKKILKSNEKISSIKNKFKIKAKNIIEIKKEIIKNKLNNLNKESVNKKRKSLISIDKNSVKNKLKKLNSSRNKIINHLLQKKKSNIIIKNKENKQFKNYKLPKFLDKYKLKFRNIKSYSPKKEKIFKILKPKLRKLNSGHNKIIINEKNNKNWKIRKIKSSKIKYKFK